VTTSIIGADSLMGVKYVLSPYSLNGLQELPELGEYNGKKTYLNPYALPMAFTYHKSDAYETEYTNPFEYQNRLYSELLGETVELYKSVEYEIIQQGDVDAQTEQIYQLTLPQGNMAIYANIPWSSGMDAHVSANGSTTIYAKWLSPSVVYVPTQEGDETAFVTLSSSNGYNIQTGSEQFYALDLDLLEQVAGAISSREAETCTMENGRVEVQVYAKQGENLYLSVPYNQGWTVTVNGALVEPELFGDCFYSIPLQSGENTVELRYTVPYLKLGAVVSLLCMILLLGITAAEHKRNRRCPAL
jgi:hypothetical protein